jgi:ribosomal protein S18 acetylase RimI-like enzyme
VTVERVKTAHVPALMRITGLLLPVRYPNSFYTAIITDPVIASVSRVAIYHDHPVAEVAATFPKCAMSPSLSSSDKVVGGIRCRLESLTSTLSSSSPRPSVNLYIQTLHLLSPYRGCGVAATLLSSLIFDSPSDAIMSKWSEPPVRGVSAMVKHYNIRIVTAHVHESNEEALLWYVARGFTVEDGVIEGYYRRLKPSGAKIVRLDLEWVDEESSSQLSQGEGQG